MSFIKWIKYWFLLLLFIPFFVLLNYLIDPYNIYANNIFGLEKTKQPKKIRLSKIETIKRLKPKVLVMGTSRVENGYNPNHEYFENSGYNFGLSGASMYEVFKSFEFLMKKAKPKKVLLVVDWIMFNSSKQTKINDFDSYFDENFNKYEYLFSVDMLNESLSTIIDNIKGEEEVYLNNGQLKHNSKRESILNHGGHLNVMKKEEAFYYKNYTVDNKYNDTERNSFKDFELMLSLAYKNSIELTIIFGPSHIRQWEAFDYYHDYEILLNWKRDIVFKVNEVAKIHKVNPFEVIDFSLYNMYTSEKVPEEKNIEMNYHWEGSHYKNNLGELVLDAINKKNYSTNFGIKLTMKNIDKHLENLKVQRKNHINIGKYKKEISNYLLERNMK